MRQVMKYAVAATVGAVVLAGCVNSSTPARPSGSNTTAVPAPVSDNVRVGIAYDVDGRGDHSFNDAAAAGLAKAAKELGVSSKESAAAGQETDLDREQRLRELIEAGYTTIVAVGSTYAKPIGRVARENPNVKFAIVDDASADSTGPNIENTTFAVNEGSFLVGAAAALKSKSNRIGFIGGVETDLTKEFQAGYEAGAKAVNPNIDIDVKYLSQLPDRSGSADVAKGRLAAESMYQAGADVIYHAAGASGGGVFTAAKEAGGWAIGVGSDQAITAAPEVQDIILTSMVKKVDIAVYDFVKSVKEGSFEAGVKVMDLEADGVDYSLTGGHIDDIKDKLNDYKAKIISGEITVPER